MDIKINGSRLKNMFSYDWVKILISIIAGIVVWSLLFTTLGTRITVGEEFYFTTYEKVQSVSHSNNGNLLKKLKDEGILSYDVLEWHSTTITSAGQYSASYMLNLRTTTNEGDVIIMSDGRGEYVKEGEENTTAKSMETAINSRYFYNIEEFLNDAKSYCIDNGFITVNGEDYSNYTVNNATIERYFLTERINSAGNYRKTYRTEAKKQEGVKNEIIRIENVYKNWLSVTNAIKTAKDEGNDIIWYGEIKKYDSEGKEIEGQGEIKPFGIDLYKLNKNYKDRKKIEDSWFTYTNNPEGEGERTTAEGLVLCVFNFESAQRDMQYESLAFMNYIIKTYSGY
ncbi:MAG: hypothetical protein E7360_00340 [Clostridiales bacterium]|nr:hypothetical protein [Clostridiales bacterium]